MPCVEAKKFGLIFHEATSPDLYRSAISHSASVTKEPSYCIILAMSTHYSYLQSDARPKQFPESLNTSLEVFLCRPAFEF